MVMRIKVYLSDFYFTENISNIKKSKFCIFLSKKDKTEALDSDIIAVNEKETLGAKGKRYNTGNKADNSAG